MPRSAFMSCVILPSVDRAAPSSVGSIAGTARDHRVQARRNFGVGVLHGALDCRRQLRAQQLVQRAFVARLEAVERQLCSLVRNRSAAESTIVAVARG